MKKLFFQRKINYERIEEKNIKRLKTGLEKYNQENNTSYNIEVF